MPLFLKKSPFCRICIFSFLMLTLFFSLRFLTHEQAYGQCQDSAESCNPVEVSDYYHLQCAINLSDGSEEDPTEIIVTDWIGIDSTVVVKSGKHVVISALDHKDIGLYREDGFRDNLFSVGENAVLDSSQAANSASTSSLTLDGISLDGGGEQVESVVTKYDFTQAELPDNYGDYDGSPTKEEVLHRDTQSAIHSTNGSVVNLYGVKIYDNRSDYFPTLNIGGKLKLSNSTITQNYSGDKYAIAYNSESKVYLDEFVQIMDNINSKGEADMLVSGQSCILIDRYFEMDSKVKVNFGPITIPEGTLLASTNCDDVEYFGDFGMAAKCFYIDDDWDLTPYVHDNQILALMCDLSKKEDGFIRGKGTPQNPYEISSAEEMLRVSDYSQSSFVVVQDLNLDGFVWSGLCAEDPYEGFFDGRDHVLFNISPVQDLDVDNETKGLFKFVDKSGIVRNYYLSYKNLDRLIHV